MSILFICYKEDTDTHSYSKEFDIIYTDGYVKVCLALSIRPASVSHSLPLLFCCAVFSIHSKTPTQYHTLPPTESFRYYTT